MDSHRISINFGDSLRPLPSIHTIYLPLDVADGNSHSESKCKFGSNGFFVNELNELLKTQCGDDGRLMQKPEPLICLYRTLYGLYFRFWLKQNTGFSLATGKNHEFQQCILK
jgi:hypothetical protein